MNMSPQEAIVMDILIDAVATFAFKDEPPYSGLSGKARKDRRSRAVTSLFMRNSGAPKITEDQLRESLLCAFYVLKETSSETPQVLLARLTYVLREYYGIERLPAFDSPESLRVHDLRSDDYKKIEDEMSGSSAHHPDSNQLIALLQEAKDWGCAHSWPAAGEYPQATEVRSIGQKLHLIGGLREMQRLALYVQLRYPHLIVHLDMFWNGVGDWRS
jgi:hypothetical protein